jgi:hypothetical protein
MNKRAPIAILLMAVCSARAQSVPELIRYQGRLVEGTNLANADVSLALRIYTNSIGLDLQYEDAATVTVTDGLYGVYLGDDTALGNLRNALTACGTSAWLRASVNGTALLPLERMAAAPFALVTGPRGLSTIETGLYAWVGGGATNRIDKADVAVIAGGYQNTIQSNTASAATIGGGAFNAIDRDCNAGVIAGGFFNAVRTNATYAGIGGGGFNTVGPQANYAWIGGGQFNTIQTNAVYAWIGGGSQNRIGLNATNSALAGGVTNRLDGLSGFIGGGQENSVQALADFAVLGGGYSNVVEAPNAFSAIGGGEVNTIEASANGATIAGGAYNRIATSSVFSTIGGGLANLVGGRASHAAIGGGATNTVLATNGCIVGGAGNSVGPGADHAWIGGGLANSIASNAIAGGIAGGTLNRIGTGCVAAVIRGGVSNVIEENGIHGVILGGLSNVVGDTEGLVLGGSGGKVVAGSTNSAVIGGRFNRIINSSRSYILGGEQNAVAAFGFRGLRNYVCGGRFNVIEGLVTPIFAPQVCFIAGGANNYTLATSCTIAGGHNNRIEDTVTGTNRPYYSFIIGGENNRVESHDCVVAGYNARALHENCFLWADFSSTNQFLSSTSNEVAFRCSGGVRFTTDGGGANQTVAWQPGDGSWTFTSDRNAKERFAPVDPVNIAHKLADLPMSAWNYIGYPQRHIGPMAQDFHETFPWSGTETTLNSADLHGVTLAAIQGLQKKLAEQEEELQRLDTLEQRMDAIRARLDAGH